MPTERIIFHLAEKYSFDEDTALKVFLRENAAVNIEISAQNLRRIDSLLVQYLIAAARAWAAKGLKFELTNLQSELGQALDRLGVHTGILGWKVAQ